MCPANTNACLLFLCIIADGTLHRAWHFPTLLLADRSAAFRGQHCGSKTQRTVAEAIEKMRGEGRLPVNWWESVRQNVSKFAGAEVPLVDPNGLEAAGAALAMPNKIVVTYISRQSTRRRLVEEHHEVLVKSLQELVQRKNAEWLMLGRSKAKEWELNVVRAEQLTKDEQVRLAASSSVGYFSRWVCLCLTILKTNRSSLAYTEMVSRTSFSCHAAQYLP